MEKFCHNNSYFFIDLISSKCFDTIISENWNLLRSMGRKLDELKFMEVNLLSANYN